MSTYLGKVKRNHSWGRGNKGPIDVGIAGDQGREKGGTLIWRRRVINIEREGNICKDV